MTLFTFIVERAGGTFVSQHRGTDIAEAAKGFVAYANDSADLCIGLNTTELSDQLRETVALDGLVNAFCATYLDNKGELWLINMIETVSSHQKAPI